MFCVLERKRMKGAETVSCMEEKRNAYTFLRILYILEYKAV
jgi:hypothetical protein